MSVMVVPTYTSEQIEPICFRRFIEWSEVGKSFKLPTFTKTNRQLHSNVEGR